MKKTGILFVFSIIYFSAHAQYVIFHSAGFEAGVKMHLGLSLKDSVLTAQADTITSINLSELDIKDIRDVVWLKRVRKLDLSKNQISDVEPLLLADSLKEVNLRHNNISDIAPLIFSRSDSLNLNVGNNHIDNFSMFYRPTHCVFTLQGIANQTERNAPYLSVYSLYSDIKDSGTISIAHRAYTNIDKQVYLSCGAEHTDLIPDGTLQHTPVPGNPKSTSLVCLTNGEQGDTTYVVPPTLHIVNGGQSIAIDTELPETYRIGFANCLYGTVEVVENKLQYTAPESSVADTLYFAFYEGNKLRGFSQYYLAKDPTAIKSVKDDMKKNLVLSGNQLSIRWKLQELAEQSTITVFSPSGQLLASKQVDSSNGIDTTISVNGSRYPVLIVQVVSGKKKWIEKLMAR